jgi:hypothetical protein
VSVGGRFAALLIALGMGAARAADYAIADPGDAQTLERSLFLCLWKTGHGAPDGEPSPVACTAGLISTDDAVHETKQWWTYWARFAGADEAMKARIRFNADFQDFQARQRDDPELAATLLPQAGRLRADDWRVMLVQDLITRARARLRHPAPPTTADP